MRIKKLKKRKSCRRGPSEKSRALPSVGTARLMTSPSLEISGFVFYLPRDGWRMMVPPTDFIRASKSAMFS
jgi:hypothetical protein